MLRPSAYLLGEIKLMSGERQQTLLTLFHLNRIVPLFVFDVTSNGCAAQRSKHGSMGVSILLYEGLTMDCSFVRGRLAKRQVSGMVPGQR